MPGDSIDLAYPTLNSRRGRVGHQIAHTVTTNSTQGLFFIDMNPPPHLTELARCITARQDGGISHHKGERSGVLLEEGPRAVLTPDKAEVRQQGRRMKEPNETTLLFLGLMTFTDNMLLGLGIMLAANEVPRIAQQFGLDSSVRVNMMSVVHATTTAVNLTRSVARSVK